jgi:hypothetical protein
MVILNIEVLVPGNEVGKVLGSVNTDSERSEETANNAGSRPMGNQQKEPKTALPPSKIYTLRCIYLIKYIKYQTKFNTLFLL